MDDAYFEDVTVHVAHPGDSTRIIHAVDVVEPRAKLSGPGCVFPGVIGPPVQVGGGRTVRLSGMAVVTTSEPAAGEGYYWREAILDMSGAGARYSPFSQNANLVLEITPRLPRPDTPAKDVEMINTIRGSAYSQRLNLALREAQIGLASYLAETVAGSPPSSVDTYELTDVDSTLPRVAYCMHRSWVNSSTVSPSAGSLLCYTPTNSWTAQYTAPSTRLVLSGPPYITTRTTPSLATSTKGMVKT